LPLRLSTARVVAPYSRRHPWVEVSSLGRECVACQAYAYKIVAGRQQHCLLLSSRRAVTGVVRVAAGLCTTCLIAVSAMLATDVEEVQCNLLLLFDMACRRSVCEATVYEKMSASTRQRQHCS